MVLEAGQSKISMPSWLGSSDDSLPGLQMAVFLLHPHKADRVIPDLLFLLQRYWSHFKGSAFIISFNLTTS